MKPILWSRTAGFALAVLWTAPVLAQAPAAPIGDANVDDGPSAVAFVARPVDASALASYRGGAQVVHNDMTLAGTTAENTANHVNTGNNAIGTGAFSSMSGIPVVIQNTGANVLIQNALIVHMQMN
jgi:hypothetical protein